ncbi:MAG TPA: hypothetical protein VKA31_08970 [Mariprofundaceae bacterium]|nr:hypothetical protein [Mariprofundaceae bacterium]
MKTRLLLPVILFLPLLLAACSDGMPKLFWSTDEGDKPAYAQGSSGSSDAASRAPLDVPPELRNELEVPAADSVASQSGPGAMPERYKDAVAGKAVRLDERFYAGAMPADVFSAAVDAMTALNVPVTSVDSPSGIVLSDWVRKGKSSSFNLFGFGGSQPLRYRYIVRVYKATTPAGEAGTQLEIRTIGQVFEPGTGWVTKPIKQQPVNELFEATGEQLTRMQRGTPPAQVAAPANGAPAPADPPAE